LVLALGNETETASATPGPDNQNLTTVTLAVNPKQANLLAAGDVYTTLRLALRSPNESLTAYAAEPIAFGVAPTAPVAAAAAPMAAATVVAPPIQAAPATRPTAQYIPIIEGDQVAPAPETHR
jgi:Flp pilus assembly protein CpaB